LTESLNKLRTQIRFCKTCHTISDNEECTICLNPRRDHSILCIVEESKDVMAIENTSQYTGVYHVLGGIISPIQGVGPAELNIESLLQRVTAKNGEIKEVILALSPTMEGDTTAFYLHRRLKDLPVKITSIARGIPMGGDLEYADEITLGRSITARVLFT
jgi:recombination protein RecR